LKSTIGLINLGCAKNIVDAEIMLGILHKDGYKITLDEKEADIVIINTCSFIKAAETESVKAVVKIAESGKKLIITGCLAQKYKHELMEAVPEALAIVGTSDIDNICDIVKSIDNKNKSVYKVSDLPEYNYNERAERFQITVGSSSYIKIAEGCNYSCSYCIIPALRGSYRSRTIESIVNEAEKLAKKGVSEIVLIAQDTTSYGKDIYGQPQLAELLEKLNELEDISWIRIMYTYPSLVTDKLIKTIASLDKVVKYIDIPLQHSHPEILKLMNRPPIDNSDLIKKLRDNIPDIAIRTAFITGFPGETEEHYEHLYNFIEEHKFDKLGIFKYSREKNTGSYSLKNQIPVKIKNQRYKSLMQLQQSVSTEINRSLIGKTIPVIVETLTSTGKIIGRSYRDAPEIDGIVYIETPKAILPGDVIDAKIVKSSEYDLFAEY
jgi:ribosomal protein S12 methylthiotransferase